MAIHQLRQGKGALDLRGEGLLFVIDGVPMEPIKETGTAGWKFATNNFMDFSYNPSAFSRYSKGSRSFEQTSLKRVIKHKKHEQTPHQINYDYYRTATEFDPLFNEFYDG